MHIYTEGQALKPDTRRPSPPRTVHDCHRLDWGSSNLIMAGVGHPFQIWGVGAKCFEIGWADKNVQPKFSLSPTL